MTDDHVHDDEVAELARRVSQAAVAFIRGDMAAYMDLITHAEDYTLMAPYGGDIRRGFDRSEKALAANAETFRGGDATFDLDQSYVSGDLAVLTGVERQRGVAFGLPEQDWSLRVTLVFRRDGEQWLLVHRHADPLAHAMRPEVMATVARGEAG